MGQKSSKTVPERPSPGTLKKELSWRLHGNTFFKKSQRPETAPEMFLLLSLFTVSGHTNLEKVDFEDPLSRLLFDMRGYFFSIHSQTSGLSKKALFTLLAHLVGEIQYPENGHFDKS